MKLFSSPKLNSIVPASKSSPVSGALQQAKSLAMRFGTRALIGASLVTGAAACSDDVSVTSSQNADASGGVDGGRLSQQDSGSSSQDSGSQDSGNQKNDTSSTDAGKPALPCDPIPYCPDPKLGLTPYPTSNFYLETNRWFRVDPATEQIHKVCEPVKMPTCDETKDETPQKNGCDLPRCPDAKACDPIPSVQSNPFVAGGGPYFARDFAHYPTNLYAQSNWSNQGDLSMFWNPQNPIVFPMIFDNVPDCKPGEKPKEGESYYTCDILPTCAQTIPYCDPLPRCAPGQAAMSFIPGDKENDAGLDIPVETCIANLQSRLQFIASPYHVDILPALEKLCGPGGLNQKNNVFVIEAKMNCLPIPECKPGEKPVYNKEGFPLTLDLGTLGVVASATSLDQYEYDKYGTPSCEPIPSCPKK